jgi:hypothetical protein
MALLKTYSILTDVSLGEVKNDKLHKEIKSSGYINDLHSVDFGVDSIEIFGTSISDEVNLDALVLNHEKTSLGELKILKFDDIDTKTGELIAQGFTYTTKVFSMSENAQNNLLGTYSAKELLTYPFPWNTKDDSETYQIADATEMATFFMTALAFKKAQQDSGTVLKGQVRDAVDIADVDLIIDNR